METGKKWFIGGLTVLNFFALLYFGYSDKTVAMGLSLASFVILLILLTSEGIKEIVAPNIKIKSKLKKVDNKIKELKELAKLFSKGVLDSKITLGRTGGEDPVRQESFRKETIDFLRSLNIPDKEIDNIQSHWLKIRQWDHSWRILGKLQDLKVHISEEIRLKFADDSIEGKNGLNGLKKYLTEENTYTQINENDKDEVEQLFEDYEFYFNNKDLRRPEIWGR